MRVGGLVFALLVFVTVQGGSEFWRTNNFSGMHNRISIFRNIQHKKLATKLVRILAILFNNRAENSYFNSCICIGWLSINFISWS